MGFSSKKIVSLTGVSSTDLDKLAINAGFGYKYANLKELQRIQSKLNIISDKIRVNIPAPLGISSNDICNLMTGLPSPEKGVSLFDWVSVKWQSLLYSSDCLTDEQINALEQIQHEIESSFSNQEAQSQCLIHPIANQITTFLKSLPAPSYLMIRSTGKEDSDTNSNAGGNDSKAYVLPQLEEIFQNIGAVIASYFGPRSVGQRLFARDSSLQTDRSLFVPVLIQPVVGNGESVSGVMLTERITRINTAIGHNEGVVKGLVPVNTYLISDQLNAQVHAVWRNQTQKIAPIDNEEVGRVLFKIDTTEQDRQRALLPDTVLNDLHRIGQAISAHYGQVEGQLRKDMDIEFTMDIHSDGTYTLHLLQARPLLKTADSTPSFLTPDVYQKSDFIQCEIVLPGKNQVQFLEKQNAIIDTTLHLALKRYQNSPNKSDIQVMVVKTLPPDNSHAAVILRPTGITVLCIPNDTEFDLCRLNLQLPCVLDAQRGRILPQNPDASITIHPGYTTYPITPQLSFSTASPDPKMAIKQVKEAIRFINQQQSLLFENKVDRTRYQRQSIFELMEALKSIPTGHSDGSIILNVLFKRLVGFLNQLMKTHSGRVVSHGPFVDFVMILQRLTQLIPELFQTLRNEEPYSLTRLFPIKILEIGIFGIGIFGIAKNPYILSAGSIKLLIREIYQNHELDRQTHYTISSSIGFQVTQLGRLIANSTVRSLWQDIMSYLSSETQSVPEQAKIYDIAAICIDYAALNILEDWLNILFSQILKFEKVDVGTPLRVADKIIQDYEHSKSLLSQIRYIQVEMTQLETLLPKLENPNQLHETIQSFRSFFTTTLFPFFQKYHSDASSNIGQLTLLRLIKQSVDLWDHAIKTLKSAEKIDVDTCLMALCDMLGLYRDLLEQIGQLVSEEDQKLMLEHGSPLNPNCSIKTIQAFLHYLDNGIITAMTGNVSPGFKNLVTFLQTPDDAKAELELPFFNLQDNLEISEEPYSVSRDSIDNVYQDSTDREIRGPYQLSKSAKFKVEDCMIGNGMDLVDSVQWPVTLEDYFTTFHQNCEQIFAKLLQNLGLTTETLPTEIGHWVRQFQSGLSPMSISDIQIRSSECVVKLNRPLGAHAARFEVRYTHKDPNFLELFVSFSGADERHRWDLVAGLAVMMGGTPQIQYPSPTGVSWRIRMPIKNEDLFSQIKWQLCQIFESTHVSFEVEYNYPVILYMFLNKIDFNRHNLEESFSHWATDFLFDRLPSKFCEHALIYAEDLLDLTDVLPDKSVGLIMALDTLKGLQQIPSGDYNRGYARTPSLKQVALGHIRFILRPESDVSLYQLVFQHPALQLVPELVPAITLQISNWIESAPTETLIPFFNQVSPETAAQIKPILDPIIRADIHSVATALQSPLIQYGLTESTPIAQQILNLIKSENSDILTAYAQQKSQLSANPRPAIEL